MILLSAFALLLASTADAPSVRVGYSDLDLATAAGAATLERRIAQAVDAVCPAATTRQLTELHAIRACRSMAFRQADRQRGDTPATVVRAGR